MTEDKRITGSRPDVIGPLMKYTHLKPCFDNVKDAQGEVTKKFNGDFKAYVDLTDYIAQRVAIYGEALWLREGITAVALPKLQLNRQIMIELENTYLQYPVVDGIPHSGEKMPLNVEWKKTSLDNTVFKALPKIPVVQTTTNTVGKIALLNGILDIQSGELTPHPPDFCTFSHIPITYDPDARCPKTDAIMAQIFEPDQYLAWKSMLGARLTGIHVQHYCILHGGGGQGKGVVRDHTRALFGNMFTTAAMADVKDRFRSQGMVGKTIIWNSEVPAKRQDAELMNDITGGTVLSIEYKGINGLTQIPLQALICLDVNGVNELPNSLASSRRLQYYVMKSFFTDGEPDEATKKYKRNKTILQEIVTPEEMSGFLNVLLASARHYLETQKLQYILPEAVDKLNDKANSIARFCEEFTEVREDSKVRTDVLKSAYNHYCAQDHNGAKPSYTLVEYLKRYLEAHLNGKYVMDLSFNEDAFAERYGIRYKIVDGYLKVTKESVTEVTE